MRLTKLTAYQMVLEQLKIRWDRLWFGTNEKFAQIMLVQPDNTLFPWIVFSTCDSVAILVVNIATNQVLLVKQWRPTMITENNPMGEILEVVAGRLDSTIPLEELIIKEVKEETLFEISKDEIIIINKGVSLSTTPGTNTEKMALAAVIIHDMERPFKKVRCGNKEEGENIETVLMSIEEFLGHTFSDLKTFALQQWFENQINQ